MDLRCAVCDVCSAAGVFLWVYMGFVCRINEIIQNRPDFFGFAYVILRFWAKNDQKMTKNYDHFAHGFRPVSQLFGELWTFFDFDPF